MRKLGPWWEPRKTRKLEPGTLVGPYQDLRKIGNKGLGTLVGPLKNQKTETQDPSRTPEIV